MYYYTKCVKVEDGIVSCRLLNPLMNIVPFLEHDLYMVNARFHVIASS